MITKTVLKKVWDITGKQDQERMATLTKAPSIKEICNIDTGGKGNINEFLDIYYPENTTGKLPVIIDIHGGGWTYGDKELNKFYALDLAARGFVVVGTNYTLLWDAEMPQMFYDLFTQFNWIMANGADYFMDLDNIFVTGDSAGGHLAVTCAAIAESHELQNKLGIKTDIKFKAVCTTCGATNMERYESLPLLNGFRKMCFGKKPKSHPLYWLLYPMRVIDPASYPPVFISTSTKDFVRPHCLEFRTYCAENGIDYEFICQDDKASPNKLEHVFNVTHPDWPESIFVNDAQCDFFRKYIS